MGQESRGRCRRRSSDDDAILTGQEFIQQYLEPLSRLSELETTFCWRTPVQRIARKYSLKSELVGDPRRGEEAFRLLVRRIDQKQEDTVEADIVLDCSGTYGNHNWLGAGGAPCPGELQTESDIKYEIPMLPYFDGAGPNEGAAPETPSQYVGERTLLVGAGHSAATTVLALAQLRSLDERTEVLWVTRREGQAPVVEHAEDRLSERDNLAKAANDLATSSPVVQWLGGHVGP